MGTTIMSTAQFVGLLVAPLMALVVGYVTKKSWPAGAKSVLLLALASVNGVLVEAFAEHPAGYSIRAAIMSAIVAFVVAIATHYGLLKPTGLTEAVANRGVVD